MADWNPLAPRARVLFHLQALSSLALAWVPMLGAVVAGLAIWWQVFGALMLGAAVFFVLFVGAVWLPTFQYERWGYLLRDEDLLITSGVLLRRVSAIPTYRIQHVDTQQGPLEQWLGLASVHVHTASGLGGRGTIPGLWVADAESLRDTLIQRSQQAQDDGV